MSKVLIVEDEALSAMLLERQLRLRGFEVLKPVPTGEGAIESAERHRPDFILMDIRLAGPMDGIEAARRIAETVPHRLIFTSGYQDGEFYEKALALRPVAYMTKPIAIDTLLRHMGYQKDTVQS